MSLLVIDDDEVFNATLVRLLKRRGREAVGALNADSALNLAQQMQAREIILDLNLGGENGLTLIPRLLDVLPEVRILVLTGYASISTAVDAIKLGAFQYLAKPVEVDAILKALSASERPETATTPPDKPLSVDRLAWEHIQRVLAEHDGNISATARALNMHRRTLQRKLLKRPARS